MNDALQNELASILSALRDAATTYGPDALNLALNLRRVEAAGELFSGVAGILIPLLLILWAARHTRRVRSDTKLNPGEHARIRELRAKGYDGRRSSEDSELTELLARNRDWIGLLVSGPQVMLLIIPAVPAFIWITESVFKLLDIWNWVGLFRPELALAHDLLVKVTGQ